MNDEVKAIDIRAGAKIRIETVEAALEGVPIERKLKQAYDTN